MRIKRDLKLAKIYAPELPKGYRRLGVITHDTGASGALIVDPNGNYFRVYCAKYFPLNQTTLNNIMELEKKGITTSYVKD